MSDSGNQIERLLRTGHPCVLINTFEEADALDAVRTAALNLGRPLWIWASSGGVQEGLLAESPPVPKTEDPIAGFAYLAERDRNPICVLLDVGAAVRNERPLRALRNLMHQQSRRGGQLVLIDHGDDVPAVIRAYSVAVHLPLPTEEEIEALVRSVLRRENDQSPIEIDISRRGLAAIIRNLCGLTRRQAEQVIRDLVVADRRFDDEDINRALAAKRRAITGESLLEYVETPVDLCQIGGLERLKRWLSTRQGALTPEAVAFGIAAPRGVLMLGVQGAGKSLAAKAIATAWQRPLLRLEVGALYDRYIGESERRLREALRQAGAMAPNILWIDEIEKAFASAASRSSDGGLSQRMFGTLLTWMQERQEAVFLVATANDIEALPPELLRKGRFDEIFFVDLPGEAARRQIFEIHLRKRKRDPEHFDLSALVEKSDGFSGAEIEQSIVSALNESFVARRELDTAAVVAALEGSPPLSVTMAERIAALREWAEGRCVPAE
ncbi:MAG: AAA family ATPase [Phycisphaerales bacterium]|nr:AAA family ATPase [Phycisphaerales bacterium]